MTNESARAPDEDLRAIPAPRIGKGVTATWWYTVISAASFILAVLFVWSVALIVGDATTWGIVGFAVGAIAWTAVFALSAVGYRRRESDAPLTLRGSAGVVFAVGALAAGVAGVGAASATLALSLVFVLVGVLPWARGIRGRVTAFCTVVLAIVAGLEWRGLSAADVTGLPLEGASIPLIFAAVLPVSIVSMLWWWDIVRELDRARAAEGRLAAAQERLILAGDVHDLQGHHLQVIALQLELAERLIRTDPDGALDQLKAAQDSVDDARTGTRELATRFRSVTLSDEFANAADLLRSAGLRVEVEIDADIDLAPTEELGPVIRESTTNILKHGGGVEARLRLVRHGSEWRFSATNDLPAAAAELARTEPVLTSSRGGTGIVGMIERVERTGGALDARATSDSFELAARIPVRGDA